MDKEKERYLSTCKYFTGLMNITCEALVVYKDTKNQAGKFSNNDVYPCFGNLQCDKRQFPTIQEWEEKEKQLQQSIKRIGETRKRIVIHSRAGNVLDGSIKCQYCDGTVYYSVASSNGHIHAKCTTDSCIYWME